MCANLITDSVTNNISLINIIEEITIKIGSSTPDGVSKLIASSSNKSHIVVPYQGSIVSFWERTTDRNEDFEARYSIIDPHGKTLSQSQPAQLTITKPRLRSSSSFSQVHAHMDGGRHVLRTHTRTTIDGKISRWRRVGEIPFQINIEAGS